MKVNKNQILTLRIEGKTYSEIANLLGCSKFTVLYHCKESRRKSIKKSNKSYRDSHPLFKKLLAFFKGNSRRPHRPVVIKFTIQELLNKLGPNPKCYLTGRTIDLNNPKSYSLGHIIPVSKGGISSLENCGLLCIEANYAKQNLSVENFISLCKEVTSYNK